MNILNIKRQITGASLGEIYRWGGGIVKIIVAMEQKVLLFFKREK